MSGKLPQVSVVILNWNRPEDTLECLESIRKIKISGYILHVIVVDNASSDDSVKQLKKFKKKFDIKIIENKENLGFAEGNNVGMRHAINCNSNYALVLNNDTIVHRNLIIDLIDAAKKHKKAGVITPKIYFAKGFEFHKKYEKNELGRVIWSAGGLIDWDNVYGSNRGVDEVDKGQYDKDIKTDYATGACSFFRTKALREVGLYDKKYFMYFEDSDLSIRMKRKKWEVWYAYKPVIWHKVSQSSKIGGYLNDYFITRNRMHFGMKYASARTRFALYRESIRFLLNGRKWQKTGIRDYYLNNFSKGSYK